METSQFYFAVPKTRFSYETESWKTLKFELPYTNGDYVILTLLAST